MYSSSGADARSAASFNARDSPSSMPSDHPSSWDKQVCGRDELVRTDRDRHLPGKEWLSDRPSSSQSHRTSNVHALNGSQPGPPSKRRALGRYGAVVENGRYGIAASRPSDSSVFRGISSPVGNGKADRDAFVLSGGRSPGFNGSPGTERFNKAVDGHPLREPYHSPSDGRPASSPSPDLASRSCGGESTHEGVGSWERSKFRSPHRWDTLDKERDSKERTLAKVQFYRRTGSLWKLDTGRDWSLGDGELEGRLDRYGIASNRDQMFPDVLSGSKEHSRHDWRGRDKALLSSLSSETPACPSNNGHLKETSTVPLGSEVSGMTLSPHLHLGSTVQESCDNVGHTSPKKRPRLTWGQGLAKYEKEKVEEDPTILKKTEELMKDDGFSTQICSSHASQGNQCPQPYQNHDSPGVINCSLENECVEPSPSRTQDTFTHARQEMSTKQTVADEQDAICRNFDVKQDRSPQLMSEHSVLTSRTSVLDDAQVLIASYYKNTSSLSKDFLMEQVEKLEFEIDIVEKELVRLGNEQEIPQTSVKTNEIEMPGGQDCKLIPVSGAISSPVACTQNEHVAACQTTVGMVLEGGHSMEKAVLCEAQDSKNLDVNEGYLPEIVVGSSMADCSKVDVEVAEVNQSMDPPGAHAQKQPVCEMDQGSSLEHCRECVSRLLQANQEMAKLSWATLSHLLPSCHVPGVGMIDSKLYSNPQEAAVWKLNIESHDRKKEFLECKVSQENSFLKFAGRVLAVKYRALRESWKQDHIGNVQRKDRAKALRRRDPERSNGSVPPSQRSSLRLHPVTCPSTVDEVQVVRRLLRELPIGSQRTYLRMPSMLLDDKERALHRFVTRNSLVEDPVAVEQERKDMNPWTGEEKKIFLDKFSLFGKSFSKIASFLEHKTVADCVQFYYRNQKSSEDFEKARRKHQLKKRRDYSQSSASYLATMTSVSSRRREVSDARAEGLTLMAAAAAAMSVPRDFSKVVRNTNRIVERARHLSSESGSMDAPSKPMNGKEKSTMNDVSGFVGLSSAVNSLKVYRDRHSNKQVCNSIVAVGKCSQGEQQLGSKGARSVHSRSAKGSCEEAESQWTESERQLFTAAVALFGKDFQSISLHVGTKSQDQCKAFFSKTQKRLGLDHLVECYEASAQHDVKVAGSSDAIKSLQNSELIVNTCPNDICIKQCITQDMESVQDERPEQQVRIAEKLDDVGLLNDSSGVPKIQGVNAFFQDGSAFGQNGIIHALTTLPTTTEGGPINDIMPVSSDGCKGLASACNETVKQEAYSSMDIKELPTGSFRMSPPVKDAPVDAVQSSGQDASSVCVGTLDLQIEPANMKLEVVSAPNIMQDQNNATPPVVPVSGIPAAVPAYLPSALAAAPMAKSALVKDKGLKVMETRTRREPTSWTQEEKDTFIDIIRKYGRDWTLLNESLPAKSLTQIKTYFQNSKAKLGLAHEGTMNGSGRGSVSRKRKPDDSDSSSNAGSGGQIAPQQVAMHTNEGSIKVSSNMLGPNSGTSEVLGGNMVGVEALAYATLFGRNSAQGLDDSISTQKLFHSMGLPQNSTAAGIVPLFNPSVFGPPGLHPVQQPYVHPTSPHQTQLVNHQQPQSSLAPLVQPLQQQITSVGIHQASQVQQQQAIASTHQDLPMSVVHLQKQIIQQPHAPSSQALLQQQQQKQVVEHLQQQVVEAVLQQQLQPQLSQRQQQLQLSAQLPHHLQQVLSHHQVQFSQQLCTQAVSQHPQSAQAGVCNQVVGQQQATGSQSKAAAQHQHQPAQAQAQLYQNNSLSQSLILQQQASQQQLQQLQMQLQQDQLQLQRQHHTHPQQKVQAQQLQKASLGSSQLQQHNFRLFHEQQLQELAILRGLCMQTSSASSAVSQLCEYDLQTQMKLPQGTYEGLQPLLVPKNSMQASSNSQFCSDAQVRAADVKLFGRSLLVQPGSGCQQTSSRVSSMASPQVALSAASTSFNTAKSSSDILSYGHGLAGNSVMQAQGWPGVAWPGASIGSSGTGSTLASVLQGSSAAKPMDGESEPHNIQETVACMAERLMQGSSVFENGYAANLAAFSQLVGVNDMITNTFPSSEHCVLADVANPRYLPSGDNNKLENDSKGCDQLQSADQAMPLSMIRGPDSKPLSVAMPGGQATSQGLRPILDALVTLTEWRLQHSNSSGRLTEEFLSKSWEALHRDPNILIEEAGKGGGILGQSFTSGPEAQYVRDGQFYTQPHLMHSQVLHNGVSGGPWVSSNTLHATDNLHVASPASSFHSHNIGRNLGSSDEQGRVESQDLGGCGAVG